MAEVQESVCMTNGIYQKMLVLVKESDQDIAEMKKAYDALKQRQKALKKMIAKMDQKMTKKENKPKAVRKPCGFARPMSISDELCMFMKVASGTMVSRTDVTKALIKYIKEHQLQDPINKRRINPDSVLTKLLGDESKDQEITYFTMQKYINKHFPKKE
jgi:chromatin remodeling complex protein RSC6